MPRYSISLHRYQLLKCIQFLVFGFPLTAVLYRVPNGPKYIPHGINLAFMYSFIIEATKYTHENRTFLCNLLIRNSDLIFYIKRYCRSHLSLARFVPLDYKIDLSVQLHLLFDRFFKKDIVSYYDLFEILTVYVHLCRLLKQHYFCFAFSDFKKLFNFLVVKIDKNLTQSTKFLVSIVPMSQYGVYGRYVNTQNMLSVRAIRKKFGFKGNQLKFETYQYV